MARTFITQEEVIALMRDGWELGYFDGIRTDGAYQVQQGGLMKGGATKGVRASSVAALERKGLVRRLPREPKQPYWCHRYELLAARATTTDGEGR